MVGYTRSVTRLLSASSSTFRSRPQPREQRTAYKSAVDQVHRRKFLGFSFTTGRWGIKRRIARQSLDRFRKQIQAMTRRTRGRSLDQIIEALRSYLGGWRAYFGFCQTPTVLRELDQWIRRRLRAIAWYQWKRGWNRPTAIRAELAKRGTKHRLAAQTASSAHGPRRIAASPALNIALSNRFFGKMGLPSLAPKIA